MPRFRFPPETEELKLAETYESNVYGSSSHLGVGQDKLGRCSQMHRNDGVKSLLDDRVRRAMM